MSAVLRPCLFLLALAACDLRPGDSHADSAADSQPLDSGETQEQPDSEWVLYLEDQPADLAWNTDGELLITTQYGGYLLSWQPGDDDWEVLYRGISGLQAVALGSEGELWACTSDGGMEGAVGRLQDGELQELATQADDGTLFRYPVDVALAPDGMLLVADRTVGAIFRTDPATGSTTALYPGVDSPRALAFSGDELYLAAADGIHLLAYPAATAAQQDTRQGWGLAVHEGSVLAGNDDDKIFTVGGEVLGGQALGRPGSMAIADQLLYVSDLAGSYLYAVNLAEL